MHLEHTISSLSMQLIGSFSSCFKCDVAVAPEALLEGDQQKEQLHPQDTAVNILNNS